MAQEKIQFFYRILAEMVIYAVIQYYHYVGFIKITLVKSKWMNGFIVVDLSAISYVDLGTCRMDNLMRITRFLNIING